MTRARRTPEPPPTADPAAATREAETAFRRIEEKLLLPRERALGLYAALAETARPDEFVPGRPVTLVTTIYCDGPSLPLFWEARRGGIRLRIRSRRYSYPAPAAEDPFCWVEWKSSPPRGAAGYTTKRRFRLPAAALGGLFSGGLSAGEVSAHQESKKAAREALRCYDALREVARGFSLGPVAATSYRRSSLLIGESGDRVTFDFDLRYRRAQLGRGGLSLGEPLGEEMAVVEVKRRAPLPDWVARALDSAGAAPALGFSKFERAVEALGLDRSG